MVAKRYGQDFEAITDLPDTLHFTAWDSANPDVPVKVALEDMPAGTGGGLDENAVKDVTASQFVAGSGVTLDVDPVTKEVTINAVAGSGEEVTFYDISIAKMIREHGGSDNFGADCTAAYNAAIGIANAMPQDIPGGKRRVAIIQMPPGGFNCLGNLDVIYNSGSALFVGSGRDATTVIMPNSGNFLRFDPWYGAGVGYDMQYCGFVEATMKCAGTPDGTQLPIWMRTCVHPMVDAYFHNTTRMVRLGAVGVGNSRVTSASLYLSGLKANVANSAALELYNVAGCYLDPRFEIGVNGIFSPPAQNTTSSIPVASGCHGIVCTGLVDTLIGTPHLSYFDRGVSIEAAAGHSIAFINLNGTVFDWCKTPFNLIADDGAMVNRIRCRNAYFNGWDGNSLNFQGNGRFISSEFSGQTVAAYDAIKFNMPNAEGVTFENFNHEGSGRKDPNSADFNMIAGKDVTVTKHRSYTGRPWFYGGGWRKNYGFKTVGNIKGLRVHDNNFEGDIADLEIETNTDRAPGSLITNNVGAKYARQLTNFLAATPASGANWFNKTSFIVDVYFSGATATLVKKLAALPMMIGLAAIKAQPITGGPVVYNDKFFTWTPGDATGTANDTTIIKADSQPLTAGAWKQVPNADVEIAIGSSLPSMMTLMPGEGYNITYTGTLIPVVMIRA